MAGTSTVRFSLPIVTAALETASCGRRIAHFSVSLTEYNLTSPVLSVGLIEGDAKSMVASFFIPPILMEPAALANGNFTKAHWLCRLAE